MGLAQDHALGRNRRFFAKAESTYGTFVKPVAGDALKMLKVEFAFDQERKDREDSRATRSVLERITGKKKVTWSAEGYLIPSGAAGTAPDAGPLYKAAMGTETVNSSTSVVYSLSATQSALGSLSLVRHFNDIFMEMIKGAWVESMTITGSGGEPPMVKFEGGGKDLITTGTSTTNGSTSGSTVTVQTADASNFAVGSVLKVGTSDNSSAGHEVTAKSGATLTVSGTPAQTTGLAITPFTPTETTAGSPIAGILGSITLDGTALPITGYEIALKNNMKAIDDEAMQDSVTDLIPGFREVTGKVSLRARKDQILHLGKRQAGFTARDFAIVIGTTAGAILTIDINYAEMLFSAVELGDKEGTFELPFKALGSSGEDELALTWT